MGALARLVRFGIAKAIQRVDFLTAPDRLDDAAVMRVIESSVVVGAVQRVVDIVGKANQSSRVQRIGRRTFDEWMQAPAMTRRIAAGTMLVVAGAVYVAATLRVALPPGWLWLVVPSLAVGIGALVAGTGVVQRKARSA